MLNPKSLGLAVALALSLSTPSGAGQAVRVIDGDTIHLGSKEAGTRVRLLDIDTAERGQTCAAAGGGEWPCGTAATERLRELVAGADVWCDGDELDRYGRLLGRCWAVLPGGEPIDLQRQLVAEGLAWPYRMRGDYVATAQRARSAKVGIWQAHTQTPWDWRKAQR